MIRLSHLQVKMILYLTYNKVDSVADLARMMDVHRSSASRSLHQLRRRGLIEKMDGKWYPTEIGSQMAEEQFDAAILEMQGAISRVMDYFVAKCQQAPE